MCLLSIVHTYHSYNKMLGVYTHVCEKELTKESRAKLPMYMVRLSRRIMQKRELNSFYLNSYHFEYNRTLSNLILIKRIKLDSCILSNSIFFMLLLHIILHVDPLSLGWLEPFPFQLANFFT